MLTAETLREMVYAFRTSRILLTSMELDIFTVIGAGGKTVGQICQETATAPRSTAMLLHALCAIGVLKKDKDIFRNTDPSFRYLNRHSEDYISGFHHTNSLWDSWSTLTEAVRCGSCVSWREREKKQSTWLVPFIEAMHDRAKRSAPDIISTLRFPGIRTILDLGGGPGTFAMELVRQHPMATATVFDLPEVINLTKKYIAAAGLADRIITKEGDFTIDPVGSGYDLILMSAIIHSYSPDQNRALIARCADALNANGILVIQDYIMDEDRTSPADGALFAINMLVNTEAGGTYTEQEVTSWMEQAGFAGISRVDTPFRTTQIIGRKS